MRYLAMALVLGVMLVGFVVGCGGGDSCNVDKYSNDTDAMLAKWDDAVDVADSTARMSLSGPIAELQTIKREASAYKPPECFAEAHTKLLKYMDATIDGYLAFMADKGDVSVNSLFEMADIYRDTFESLYWAVRFDKLAE